MKLIESEVFAKNFMHFYPKISNFNKITTVKHSLANGAAVRSTIYTIIKRYEERGCFF